ncbi:unnamed protein product [Pylaiella littoralis]
MTSAVQGEPLRLITAACAEAGGGSLHSVRLAKSSKSYLVEVIGDLPCGRRRWYSSYIKFPKCNKTRRDWSAEQLFAENWEPSDDSCDAHRGGSEAVEAPGPRQKRPWDCHHENLRAEKRPHNATGMAVLARGAADPSAAMDRREVARGIG